ncbi:MAG: ABC transporter permease [Chloroflexota bacterium]
MTGLPDPSPLPVYDSSRRGIPALEELRELLRYRNLVFQSARRNIVVRYKRSVLGVAWTMLNPLGTTLILSFVFSRVFGGTASYAVYVLSGLLCWVFFAQTTSDCMASIIWGGGLMKRIYIPHTAFAVSSIATGLVNVMLGFVPLLLVMLLTGVPPRWSMLVLPIPLFFLACFALGIGLLMSSFAIYFTDVTEMYGILLTAWMYLSPVIYTRKMLPEQYSWIVLLNPMYHIITLFRTPIYDGVAPPLADFLLTGAVSLATLLVGWWLFTRSADELAYRV